MGAVAVLGLAAAGTALYAKQRAQKTQGKAAAASTTSGGSEMQQQKYEPSVGINTAATAESSSGNPQMTIASV